MNYILEGELFSAENNITHTPPKCKPFLKKNETMRMHLKIAGIDAHICQHAPDEPGKRKKTQFSKFALAKTMPHRYNEMYRLFRETGQSILSL